MVTDEENMIITDDNKTYLLFTHQNCCHQCQFKYSWHDIEHHCAQSKVDSPAASIDSLETKITLTHQIHRRGTWCHRNAHLCEYLCECTLERAPVLLERWNAKSCWCKCEKRLSETFRIELWATRAKTAFLNSPNPAAPALAIPSEKYKMNVWIQYIYITVPYFKFQASKSYLNFTKTKTEYITCIQELVRWHWSQSFLEESQSPGHGGSYSGRL